MTFSKRITAMLLATIMLLTLVSAGAETAQNRMAQLIESGKCFETKTTFNVNRDSIVSLVSMMGAPLDEQTTGIVDTVIALLNKMTINAVSNKDGISAVVGSEAGELFNFNLAMDLKAKDVSLDSNIVPGVLMKVDPKMMEGLDAAESLNGFSQMDADKMMKPYADAIKAWVEKTSATAENKEGSFTVAGVGEYKKHAVLSLSSHQVMELSSAMIDLLSADKEMLAAINTFMAYASTSKMTVGEQEVKSIEEGIALMKPQIEEVLKADAVELAKVDIYSNDDKDVYFQVIPTAQEESAALIGVGLKEAGENSGQIKFTIATKSGVTSDEQVDWEQVLAGNDMAAQVFNISVDTNEDKAANAATTRVTFDINASGVAVSIAVDSKANLSGAYEAQENMSLSVFGKELFSFQANTKESDQVPTKPAAESAKVVTLSEEMTEEESAVLAEALQTQGVITLMTNLMTAFPEEGAAIMSLMNSAGPATN